MHEFDAAAGVSSHAAAMREALAGRIIRYEAAAARPCATCPWSTENHLSPPLEKPRPTPGFYYLREARARMWGHWDAEGNSLSGGTRSCCHQRKSLTEWRWCAGGDAIQQRELLRWWLDGRSPTPGTLTGLRAVHMVLAAVLGVSVVFGDDGELVEHRISLRLDGAAVAPHLDGEPVTLERVAPLLHPGVADPGIGCEQAAPVSAAELDVWTGLGVGSGWRTGPGRATSFAKGAA